MWRTVSLDGASEVAGGRPARIDGLPVMEVKVQQRDSGQRPLMVVAQQLQSGEVIRTIEGPASDVSSLLSRRSAGSGEASPWPTPNGGIEGRDGAMALRTGDRILAITAPLPRDSLVAMLRRLNVQARERR
jgi:hypothetical protein